MASTNKKNLFASSGIRPAVIYLVVAMLWIFFSDSLLQVWLGNTVDLSRWQTLKGVAFVIVSAALMFHLVSRSNVAQFDRTLPSAWKPLTIFAVLMLLIVAASVYSYLRLAASIRHNAESEIGAVAQLKSQQIEHGLADYRAQASYITDNSLLADEIATWLAGRKRDKHIGRRITQRLEAFMRLNYYASAMLFDTAGQPILDISPTGCNQEHHSQEAFAVMADGTPRFVDLHRDCGDKGDVEFGLISPVISDNRIVGALYLDINPDAFLYPMLQKWPGISSSAETLLVRAEGDKLRFLTRLRHSNSPPLSLTRPLNAPGLSAAAALRGKFGLISEMRDYRGVPVLAYAIKVNDTPWVMISKMDEAEALAGIRQAGLVTILISGLLMSLTGILLLNRWQRQLHYQAYQDELHEIERRALSQHYEYLSQYANDIILLSDEQAQIIEVNDRASESYGYPRMELLAMRVSDLRSIAARNQFEHDWDYLIEHKHLVFETEHQRKDGSVFPVEVSARVIEIGGKCFKQAIIRDISERKRAEARIQRLSNLYAALSQCNRAIVHCENEAELFPRVCQAAVEFGGMRMAWIGQIDSASQMVAYATSFGAGAEYLYDIQISLDAASPYGRGPTGTAIRENHPVWCQDFQNDPATAPWHERGARFGWGASASIPLLRKGVPIGSFTFYAGEVNAFDSTTQDLLLEMASDVSYALNSFDIKAERQKAAEALSKLSLAVEQSPASIVIADFDANIEYVNEAFLNVTGYSHDEVIGQNPRILQSGKTPKETHEEMWATLTRGEVWKGELINKRKDGSEYIEYAIISPVCQPDGHVTHYLAIKDDITEDKRMEAALSESRESLQRLLDSMAEGAYGVDTHGNCTFVNRAFLQILGYGNEDEVLGKHIHELIHHSHADGSFYPANECRMACAFQAQQAVNVSDEVLWRKDGVAIPIEYWSHPIVDNSGVVIGAVATFVDITERRRAEQSLRASEERYRGLVEQSIAGAYIAQDGRLAYVNPRFAEIFGYDSNDELIGMNVLSLAAEKDRSRVKETLRLRLEDGKPTIDYAFSAMRRDGVMIEVGVHGARVEYEGRPAIIGLVQDITEKQRAEEKIKRYVTQLESAFMRTVEVATTLSEMRDPYTAGHERRVGQIAVAIGEELGFDAHRLEGLRVAGYLHDIGKITLPAEILAKPGRLSATEYALIQGHPQASYDVLKNIDFPWPVAQVALQHHERLDGTGYPNGLKGDEILLESRIMAVADVIEAMASHRPYRPGLGIDKALVEIERGSGTAYDPAVVAACLRLFREKGYGLPS